MRQHRGFNMTLASPTSTGSSRRKLTSSSNRCTWCGMSNMSMAAVSGLHTVVPDLVRHKPKACTVGPTTCSREQGEGHQALGVLVSYFAGL